LNVKGKACSPLISLWQCRICSSGSAITRLRNCSITSEDAFNLLSDCIGNSEIEETFFREFENQPGISPIDSAAEI